jgi:hypothetical protein
MFLAAIANGVAPAACINPFKLAARQAAQLHLLSEPANISLALLRHMYGAEITRAVGCCIPGGAPEYHARGNTPLGVHLLHVHLPPDLRPQPGAILQEHVAIPAPLSEGMLCMLGVLVLH